MKFLLHPPYSTLPTDYADQRGCRQDGPGGWNRTNFLQLMRLASDRCSSPELETRSASRTCAGLSPLPTGCVAFYALAEFEMVAHLGAAPSISPIRTARIAVFLVPVLKKRGATGNRTLVCSMPLRRPAIERWPRKWSGRAVTLRLSPAPQTGGLTFFLRSADE